MADNFDTLKNNLFAGDGFLEHGVSMKEWNKEGRKNALKEFLERNDIDERIKLRLTIKLASEMAKATSWNSAEEVYA